MIPVFVASSPRFHHVEWMTPFSIRENTTADVQIFIICPEGIGAQESGCTGFTNIRYGVPQICRESGFSHGIYLDVDMLVLGDIAQLWEYRDAGDWVVLKDGSDEVSIFSAACEFPGIARLHEYNKRELRGMCHKTPAIPLEWNSEDRIVPDAKLLHFTDLNTQPWDVRHPDDNARLMYDAYHARYLAGHRA